jgi:hypothetical protein
VAQRQIQYGNLNLRSESNGLKADRNPFKFLKEVVKAMNVLRLTKI